MILLVLFCVTSSQAEEQSGHRFVIASDGQVDGRQVDTNHGDSEKTAAAEEKTSGAQDTAPSKRFDLTHWKLTLPIDASNTYGGHATEISASKLVAGFTDLHFRSADDGAMVFWCPVAGATTEGTKFPRCELREMLKPGDEDVNWTSQGTHTLRATCRIKQLPSHPKVVIGQIHGYSGKARPLVKLQHYKNRIEALVKISPDSGKDRKLTFADSQPGDDIDYEIRVQDHTLSITVNGQTQTEDLMKNDPEWARQTFYFKAGIYPQDNEGPLTEAACVAFSELSVNHEQ